MRKLKLFTKDSKMRMILAATTLFVVSSMFAQEPGKLLTPKEHFGFTPGDDRMLFDYEELIGYLKKLDVVSPKMKMIEIGKSPMNKSIYIAFISSEENINNLDELKKINKELALNSNIPDEERKKMLDDGKVFFLATLSMHSGEVGPSQSAPLIAYKLLTSDNQLILDHLNNVVYMMVPCHNPDGMDMIVNNYKKYKGTQYEGASLPRVYHKYVGHDNNRDFVILSQKDTKAIAAIYDKDWFPQVMVEKHQMGSTGIRYFVPPNHDPIAENIDAGIWNWAGIFGQNMIKDMTTEGLAGIGQRAIFDDYWPGSTETCIWKNVIGFLTEGASARDATPIYIEPNELSVGGKGLSEYKKSTNMPLPWEGGWWKLSDIVQYEIVSTLSIIKTASLHRRDILQFRNDLCRKEVKTGKTKPPFYYVLPREQHDRSEFVSLVNLMKEHGIDVYQLKESFTLEDRNFKQGDVVIPMSQPFRPFIKEVMESQEYPVRHYTPGGEIVRPYDITSWSLPLHRGVQSFEMKTRSEEFEILFQKIEGDFSLAGKDPLNFWAAVFSVNNNGSFKVAFMASKMGLKVDRLAQDITMGGKVYPKGSFVLYGEEKGKEYFRKILQEVKFDPGYIKEKWNIKTIAFKVPKIALVETYFHDMDAGWTRFIFDTYYIPYKIVNPPAFENTDFEKNFDVVVFPNVDKSQLMTGKYSRNGQYYMSNYHPDYVKGMGKKGKEKLMTFLNKGGIIVSWGQSTELFEGALEIINGEKKEEFQLPVSDISEQLQKSGVYVAGALAKIKLIKDHPLTQGMPDEIGVFFRGRPVFSTSVPRFDMDRRVIAKFPEKKILLSGYGENEEKFGNKTAMVWLKKGKGQLVLFGFYPQFRASTQASFKLLFNSILLEKIN
jgi:hypothetical protein